MFADSVVNTYIDGSATFPPEIWADPDIDSKLTKSNPTSTSTIGEQEGTDKTFTVYFIRLMERDTKVYLNTYGKKVPQTYWVIRIVKIR